jgi:hypothetical protein
MGRLALLCVLHLTLGLKVEVLGLKKDDSETVKGIPGECGSYARYVRTQSIATWHISQSRVVLRIDVFSAGIQSRRSVPRNALLVSYSVVVGHPEFCIMGKHVQNFIENRSALR